MKDSNTKIKLKVKHDLVKSLGHKRLNMDVSYMCVNKVYKATISNIHSGYKVIFRNINSDLKYLVRYGSSKEL